MNGVSEHKNQNLTIMANTTATQKLEATIEALDGGLQAAAPVAAGNIEEWITTLKDAGTPALTAIATELQNLKSLLSGGNLDGDKIGKSLKTLGEHTTKAADNASEGAGGKVRDLGKALTEAANSLK
jgi:predicted small secreted protein